MNISCLIDKRGFPKIYKNLSKALKIAICKGCKNGKEKF